jgi:hypothetical protein
MVSIPSHSESCHRCQPRCQRHAADGSLQESQSRYRPDHNAAAHPVRTRVWFQSPVELVLARKSASQAGFCWIGLQLQISKFGTHPHPLSCHGTAESHCTHHRSWITFSRTLLPVFRGRFLNLKSSMPSCQLFWLVRCRWHPCPLGYYEHGRSGSCVLHVACNTRSSMFDRWLDFVEVACGQWASLTGETTAARGWPRFHSVCPWLA